MGLKFRRGTTAQKSGSLAFGEPYVNTTLGTLQIGGEAGDVTLLINSASQGISGSSLDITGNAKIDGNLTLGGAITIGDATADTVNVVASLSSSLIPQTTNAFDLGSVTKIWRDLYISTGSIKVVANGAVVSTLSTNTDGSQNLPNGLTVSGSLKVSGSLVVSGSTSFEKKVRIGNNIGNSLNSQFDNALEIGSNPDINSGGAIFLANNIGTNTWAILSDTVNAFQIANNESFNSRAIKLYNTSSKIEFLYSGSLADEGAGFHNIRFDQNGIIPHTSNKYDLGSATNIWRDLYLSTGSIKMVNPANNQVVTTINAVAGGGIQIGNIQITTASISFVDNSGNITQNIAQSSSVGSTSIYATTGSNSFNGNQTITGSLILSSSADVELQVIGNAIITGSLILSSSAATELIVIGNQINTGTLVVTGSITATGDVVAYSTSDKRHKNTIVLISDALSKVSKLNGVTWEWNDDVDAVTKETPKTGLIAQEVQEVLPEVVKERGDSFLALDYSKMMGLMVEAIKELSAKVKELENK